MGSSWQLRESSSLVVREIMSQIEVWTGFLVVREIMSQIEVWNRRCGESER